jgi:DNA uptake protein ComE-like DNA-binding protein
MRRITLIAPLLALMACSRPDASTDTAAVADTTRMGATTQASAGDVQARLIDPNTATREDLVAAGVDSATVTVLVASRPFADMIAVDKVVAKNLTADQRKALYVKVWKPIDLNTATGEEILLIPGVGNRMRHEFVEYRPYKNIEQFRREIGKYVDKNEVARLEQYVTIK